jgi:hypothetical protein
MLEWARTIGPLFISWPVVAVLFIVLFRKQIREILERLTKITVGPASIDVPLIKENTEKAADLLPKLEEEIKSGNKDEALLIASKIATANNAVSSALTSIDLGGRRVLLYKSPWEIS